VRYNLLRLATEPAANSPRQLTPLFAPSDTSRRFHPCCTICCYYFISAAALRMCEPRSALPRSLRVNSSY